ncbi:MAG: hypothetical protein P8O16_09920 [Algoriphagus sp.]|uniref:hypothetical protein n=1 Tax=Algoriphagus sp. TaxID=1872435 RepID=UPI002620C170|nr:hypothetical protein [Algoriphagus sp.]MDG1277586.1 hypothetical protein [Algoriphagus sp.]
MILNFLLLFSLFITETPDYEKQLALLNETHQNCLGEGKFMMNCSMDFYNQLEELMNLILLDFQENASKEKLNSILESQKVWEIRILPEFTLINQKLDSATAPNGAVPLDELMFAYNDRARIIEDRINQLILFFLK